MRDPGRMATVRKRKPNIVQRLRDEGLLDEVPTDLLALEAPSQRAKAVPNRANNVYADKSGAVARKTNDGWETRSDGGWKADNQSSNRAASQSRDSVSQQTRTKSSQTHSSINQRDLNSAYSSRQRGASREASRSRSRGGGRRR